jgi:hypothetical protein
VVKAFIVFCTLVILCRYPGSAVGDPTLTETISGGPGNVTVLDTAGKSHVVRQWHIWHDLSDMKLALQFFVSQEPAGKEHRAVWERALKESGWKWQFTPIVRRLIPVSSVKYVARRDGVLVAHTADQKSWGLDGFSLTGKEHLGALGDAEFSLDAAQIERIDMSSGAEGLPSKVVSLGQLSGDAGAPGVVATVTDVAGARYHLQDVGVVTYVSVRVWDTPNLLYHWTTGSDNKTEVVRHFALRTDHSSMEIPFEKVASLKLLSMKVNPTFDVGESFAAEVIDQRGEHCELTLEYRSFSGGRGILGIARDGLIFLPWDSIKEVDFGQRTSPASDVPLATGSGIEDKAPTQLSLPPFQIEANGPNEVRVRNPNDFSVKVALRSGDKGKDWGVPANGVASAFVPDGRYDIYFVYSSKPNALFQGDSFTLSNNGVEIQIVKVVEGNYSIRQVK